MLFVVFRLSCFFYFTLIHVINNIIWTEGDVYRSRNILGIANNTDEPFNQTESISSNTTNLNHGIKNCTKAAILELPSDGLTRDERKQGWIILHILLACYCFWFLASICDDYFVPAIQSICSGKHSMLIAHVTWIAFKHFKWSKFAHFN